MRRVFQKQYSKAVQHQIITSQLGGCLTDGDAICCTKSSNSYSSGLYNE